MSGKWIIVFIGVCTIAAGYVMYGAFKRSPDYKSLVTDQMKMEFFDYSATIKKTKKLTLAQENSTVYSVDVDESHKSEWQFEIRNKTLFVEVAKLQADPPAQTFTESVVKSSQLALQNTLLEWLEDKYHSKKDLKVQVDFKNTHP